MAQATENKTRRFLGQILQIKRPLVSINTYAAREGVSIDTIEKFAKLGLLQIRRHKGKTFVVDLPAKPTVPQTKNPNQKEDVFESLHIIPPPKTSTPQEPEVAKTTDKTTNKTAIPPAKKPSPAYLPPQSIQMPQISYLQFEMVAAQKKLKRRWQIAATITILTLMIISAMMIRLYVNHQYNLQKLSNTEFTIKTAYSNARKVKQQAKLLENQLSDSHSTTRSLSNELNLSEVENKSLKDQLSNTRERMEITRRKNIESLNMLNTRIQKLATRITQISQPPQPQGPQLPRPRVFLPQPPKIK